MQNKTWQSNLTIGEKVNIITIVSKTQSIAHVLLQNFAIAEREAEGPVFRLVRQSKKKVKRL